MRPDNPTSNSLCSPIPTSLRVSGCGLLPTISASLLQPPSSALRPWPPPVREARFNERGTPPRCPIRPLSAVPWLWLPYRWQGQYHSRECPHHRGASLCQSDPYLS